MQTRQVTVDLTDELRSRTSVFVDKHEGIRVTVFAGNTIEFAGPDAADLLQAAADWMHEDRTCRLDGVRWEQSPEEPPLRLAIAVDRPAKL